MNNFGHWKISPDISPDIPADAIGFVYIIKNKLVGKSYIGKKLLEFKKSRRPLKGRVNSRRYKVPSDWQEYTGSSPSLNEYIAKNGKDEFEFTILHFHPSKLLLSYYEIKEIVDRNAIFSSEYYNEVLNCRFRYKK